MKAVVSNLVTSDVVIAPGLVYPEVHTFIISSDTQRPIVGATVEPDGVTVHRYMHDNFRSYVNGALIYQSYPPIQTYTVITDWRWHYLTQEHVFVNNYPPYDTIYSGIFLDSRRKEAAIRGVGTWSYIGPPYYLDGGEWVLTPPPGPPPPSPYYWHYMLIQAQSYSTPEVLSEVPGWSSTVAWNGYTPPAQNVGSVIKTTRNEFDDPIENWGPPNDWYHSYRKAFAVYGMNQKCVFVRQSEAHVLTQSKPCRGLLSSDIEKYPRDISFPKRITEWTWAEDHYATSAIEKAASEALYERAKVLEPIYLQQSVSEFRRDNYGTIRKSNT